MKFSALNVPGIGTLLTCLFISVTYFTLVLADLEPKETDDEVKPTVMLPNTTPQSGVVENVGFLHGFLASLSVILVSEIGDKTFFIAAIMAMRHPRLTVFAGAISALILMTVLSEKMIYTLQERIEIQGFYYELGKSTWAIAHVFNDKYPGRTRHEYVLELLHKFMKTGIVSNR